MLSRSGRQLIKTNKYLFKKEKNRYFDINKFEKNKLSINPQGGGFVQSVNITDQNFINDFKNEKIIFKNELPFVWKKVKLYHDHWIADNRTDLEHFIEGYVTEHKWNGWSIPMVELDQIKKFNEIQKKCRFGKIYRFTTWLDRSSLKNLLNSTDLVKHMVLSLRTIEQSVLRYVLPWTRANNYRKYSNRGPPFNFLEAISAGPLFEVGFYSR